MIPLLPSTYVVLVKGTVLLLVRYACFGPKCDSPKWHFISIYVAICLNSSHADVSFHHQEAGDTVARLDHDDGRSLLDSLCLLNTTTMKSLRQRVVDKENVYSNFVLPRRSRKEQGPFNNGPWSDTERLLFLKGLRMYGAGRWKEIGTILTTR